MKELHGNTLHKALKQYFGYTSFHPKQEEVIREVLAGRDVFVLMPTGGGKSLCYQLPAVVSGDLVVVISPLISLMKDQVDALRAAGIRAAYINSSLKPKEGADVETALLKGEIRILYVAPERIMLTRFLPLLQKLKPGLFAIDEAHCISEWGHDFRPEYRQLQTLRKYFPKTPIVALTATAEPLVREDILRQLRLNEPRVFVSSFDRKNLFYGVRPKEDAYDLLLQYLKSHKNDSGIIYCQSRKSVEALATKLLKAKFRALPYHAGLSAQERSKHQELFIRDEIQIIVATIAFGMGINKPNVRFVVHYDLPKNIESYYQETGRAGRDGLRSECLLFYSYADTVKIEHFINQKSDGTDKEVAQRKLRAMVGFCETTLCRRKLILGYFGEEYPSDNCGNCDNCLSPRGQIDATIPAQKILSCIKRTGERFGAKHIADVLLGDRNVKVAKWGHDRLSTFGIGGEYSLAHWLGFMRELAQLGYLDIRGAQYPVLALNEKSYDILKGKTSVHLSKPVKEVVPKIAAIDTDYDDAAFEFLRSVRKEIAARENVPPYIIFSDATLKALSVFQPADVADLRNVTGIGTVKLRRYGKLIFDILARYRRDPENTTALLRSLADLSHNE